MKKEFIIDGNNFNDLEGFFCEIDALFTKNLDWKTGHNLDAFKDILYGGFNVHEPNEPIKIIWKNFAKSRIDFGYKATLFYFEDILRRCHPTAMSMIKNKIKNLKKDFGETLISIIIDIIIKKEEVGHDCELVLIDNYTTTIEDAIRSLLYDWDGIEFNDKIDKCSFYEICILEIKKHIDDDLHFQKMGNQFYKFIVEKIKISFKETDLYSLMNDICNAKETLEHKGIDFHLLNNGKIQEIFVQNIVENMSHYYQLDFQGKIYKSKLIHISNFGVDELLASLQKHTDPDLKLLGCVSCRFGNYCPYGGEGIICHKNVDASNYKDKLDILDDQALGIISRHDMHAINYLCEDYKEQNETFQYNDFQIYYFDKDVDSDYSKTSLVFKIKRNI